MSEIINPTVGKLAVAAYAMALGADQRLAHRIADGLVVAGQVVPSFDSMVQTIEGAIKANRETT